jgi:T-complex protein 11
MDRKQQFIVAGVAAVLTGILAFTLTRRRKVKKSEPNSQDFNQSAAPTVHENQRSPSPRRRTPYISLPSSPERSPRSPSKHKNFSAWAEAHDIRMYASRQGASFDPLTNTVSSPSSNPAVMRSVAATIRKAFWDKHRHDMDPFELLKLLDELNTRILSFLPESRRAEFALDIDLYRQEADMACFDWDSLKDICQRLERSLHLLESPAAHALTKKFVSERPLSSASFSTEVVAVLEFFHSQVDLLEAEIGNYLLSQVSNEDKKENERRKFQDLVTTGVIDPVAMREFSLSQKNNCTFQDFYSYFVDLIVNDKQSLVHEALGLDRKLIEKMSNSFTCVERIGVLEISIRNIIKAEEVTMIPNIWSVLITRGDKDDVMTVIPEKYHSTLLTAAIEAGFIGKSALSIVIRERVKNLLLTGFGSNLGSSYAENRGMELRDAVRSFAMEYWSVYGDIYVGISQ